MRRVLLSSAALREEHRNGDSGQYPDNADHHKKLDEGEARCPASFLLVDLGQSGVRIANGSSAKFHTFIRPLTVSSARRQRRASGSPVPSAPTPDIRVAVAIPVVNGSCYRLLDLLPNLEEASVLLAYPFFDRHSPVTMSFFRHTPISPIRVNSLHVGKTG